MTIDDKLLSLREDIEIRERKLSHELVKGRENLYPYCLWQRDKEEYEQLAEWLEELKELREKKTIKHNYENCHNSTCRRKIYAEGRKDAIVLVRKLIKIFWKDWNKTSNKKLPYLAFEELDEHILEQADESNGREFMQYYKQMKEGEE